MKIGLPSSPGMPGISMRCTGSSRRSRASSVYGSRTSPDTKSSNSPKSSRSSKSCTECSLTCWVRDGLDLGVLVELGDTVLASDTAGLVSTERRIGAVARCTVDAQEARTKPLGHGQRMIDRTRHHIARKAVTAIVGDAHRVVLILVRNDDKHWAEDLFLGDGHRV